MASMSTALKYKSQNATLPDIPELFNPNFLDILLPEFPAGHVEPKDHQTFTNPLISALLEDNRTRTENWAKAYKSTSSAALDAFSSLNRWSFKQVNDALEAAWAEDPALTLRLIWNMRSIHDGKGEAELFYRAFGWLYDNHPRTALSNLHMLIAPACTTTKRPEIARSHGYWKDLLHILALATCNELSNLGDRATFLHNYTPRHTNRLPHRLRNKTRTPEEVKVAEDALRARAQEKRRNLYQQFHERLVRKLTTDNKYRALYITVARLFAEQLRRDVSLKDALKTIDKAKDKKRYFQVLRSISLAGKWAPTPSGSHDRVTNISTAICQLLFSPNENVGPMFIGPLPSTAPYPVPNDFNNCDILRSFYAHWILKPLRQVLACPEPLMSANRWTEIQYTCVPSVCMSNNKEHFLRHDPDGFQDYLVDVKKGKKKLSGATMMPHELVAQAVRLNADIANISRRNAKYPKITEFKKNMAEQEMKVVDAQWRSLVARMKENGALDNCLAICDVSGSMGNINYAPTGKQNVQPIFPALALSLVLASLNKPPFNSGFITFSSHPKFFRLNNIEETSLATIVERAFRAPWEMNTNFQAVFLDLLLPLAQQNHIAKEDMVKRLFVFSDMQFDEASTSKGSNWDTNHDLVEKAYKEAGYDVPEIVYWNLAGNRTSTFEVLGDRKGVAMMSGFSPAMMKVFMGEAEEEAGDENEEWAEVMKDGEVVEKKEDQFTPLNMMKKALFRKSFDGLVVVD